MAVYVWGGLCVIDTWTLYCDTYVRFQPQHCSLYCILKYEASCCRAKWHDKLYVYVHGKFEQEHCTFHCTSVYEKFRRMNGDQKNVMF